jgi:hypothetical protein
MSGTAGSAKVTSQHLERRAVVYVRQSTEKQVQRNTESRRMQEGLVERARELGFGEVELVEADLGCSAGVLPASSRYQTAPGRDALHSSSEVR